MTKETFLHILHNEHDHIISEEGKNVTCDADAVQGCPSRLEDFGELLGEQSWLGSLPFSLWSGLFSIASSSFSLDDLTLCICM